MIDEQPEPFFLRVWLKALAVASGDAIAFKPKQDYAAALTIQRDFAEREADLVGALRAAISALEDDTGLDEAICCGGHECGCGGLTHRQLLMYNLSTALKSREAGHG